MNDAAIGTAGSLMVSAAGVWAARRLGLGWLLAAMVLPWAWVLFVAAVPKQMPQCKPNGPCNPVRDDDVLFAAQILGLGVVVVCLVAAALGVAGRRSGQRVGLAAAAGLLAIGVFAVMAFGAATRTG